MKRILYIDATIRKESRTKRIADVLVEKLTESSSESEIRTIRLKDIDLKPLDEETLKMRAEASASCDFSDKYFDLAKEFLAANTIVLAAPYYDFSFPASVKLYMEHVCIEGLAFRYGRNNMPSGYARADLLYYVTTAGGEIAGYNMGYDYIKTLSLGLLGVSDAKCIRVVGLDDKAVDAEAVMENAINGIKNMQER